MDTSTGLAVPALAALLLAGCGGSEGKPSCSGPSGCAAGSYCAHTPDGNVCWPDARAPVLSAVSVACSTDPCRRDSALTVSATATDESLAGGEVRVAFDVDPAHPLALEAVGGDGYQLTVPLANLPFPYFEHAVVATVSARDEAGNEASAPPTAGVGVTRARWVKTVNAGTAPSLSAPAVLADGRIAVAGSDGYLHLVSKDGQTLSSVRASPAFPSGPPAVGSDAIWLAQATNLYKFTLDGVQVPLTDCASASQVIGPPTVVGTRAVAVTGSVEALVAKISNACNLSNLGSAASTAAVVGADGRLLLGGRSTLRSVTLSQSSVLTEDWTGVGVAPSAPTVGDSVEIQPIVGTGSSIWTVARNGSIAKVSSTTASASFPSPPLSALGTGAVALADGNLVVSSDDFKLVRVTEGGTGPWPMSEALQGVPTTGLVLSTASESQILVPTNLGHLYVVRASDLAVIWSTMLTRLALQPANLWTEPGAKTSTAYVAGADGNLYAIIVDGALDDAAPWPKAFHDPQNTSNGTRP